MLSASTFEQECHIFYRTQMLIKNRARETIQTAAFYFFLKSKKWSHMSFLHRAHQL